MMGGRAHEQQQQQQQHQQQQEYYDITSRDGFPTSANTERYGMGGGWNMGGGDRQDYGYQYAGHGRDSATRLGQNLNLETDLSLDPS